MTEQEAIQMLERLLDPDPWEDYGLSDKARQALEMAIQALEKQILKKPMVSIDVYNNNLRHLYCPICGSWIGMWNKRLKAIDMHNNTNSKLCAKCGQAIDTDFERWSE